MLSVRASRSVHPPSYTFKKLGSAAASRLIVSPLFACSIQQGSAKSERALLECSLVSLQAIQQAVGAESPQYKAATEITMKLVQIVQQLLSDAYDSRSAR